MCAFLNRKFLIILSVCFSLFLLKRGRGPGLSFLRPGCRGPILLPLVFFPIAQKELTTGSLTVRAEVDTYPILSLQTLRTLKNEF